MRMEERICALTLSAMLVAPLAVLGAQTAPNGAGSALEKTTRKTSAKKGAISPSSTVKRSNAGDNIVSPRDPQTGLASGKRQHKPVVLTNESGKTIVGKSTTDAATGNTSLTTTPGNSSSKANGYVSTTQAGPRKDHPAPAVRQGNRQVPARATPTPAKSSLGTTPH